MNKIRDEIIKLGALTIGQSPRNDVIPEMAEILGRKFKIIERGALDDFSYKEIITKFSPQEDEEVLVSRLNDGREVIFAEKYIIPLLQQKIYDLESEGVKAIIILCTGRFPKLDSNCLLIKPQSVLQKMLSGIINNKIGLIIPNSSQKKQVHEWWKNNNIEIEAFTATPYKKNGQLEKAAYKLRESVVELVFLDCMGYNLEMKNLVKKISDKEVILPRTMISAVIREMF